MPFKISVVTGAPVWDTLPVAKITNYPFETAAFKPFAHVRACLNEEGLQLRLLAFETKKRPESYLQASFSPVGCPRRLDVQVFADGALRVLESREGEPAGELASHGVRAVPFEGEDLEGVYWGALVSLELSWLQGQFPEVSWRAGGEIRGNFYKACTAPDFAHIGCYAPTPGQVDQIEDEKQFQTFPLVAY